MKLSKIIALQSIALMLSSLNLSAWSERVSTSIVEKSTEKNTADKKKGEKNSPAESKTTVVVQTSRAPALPSLLGSTTDIRAGFSHVAEPTLPSVVNIATTQIIDPKAKGERPALPSGTPFDELFREFFDHQQFDAPRRVQSLGSGFIIRVTADSAFIVTNNHVIADAKKITIYLNDKTEIEATVHGSDERTDIAVLKIKLIDLPESKRNLIALDWGDADDRWRRK
jgi:serine protease Do